MKKATLLQVAINLCLYIRRKNSMTKEKALSLINELQSEIDIYNVRRQFWMDKVQGYVQFIFGDNTESIALPMFGTYYWDRPYSNWSDEVAQQKVDALNELFTTYIEMINNDVYLHRDNLTATNAPTKAGYIIKSNVLRWIAKHTKEIIIGIIVTVIGGVILAYILKRYNLV